MQRLLASHEETPWPWRLRGAAVWCLLFLALPLTPLILIALLLYQGCLVAGRLTETARVATFVICVFCLVAWIPFLTLPLYVLTQRAALWSTEKALLIDGVLPMATLVGFWGWGGLVVARVYATRDAFEDSAGKHEVLALAELPLVPPITCAGTAARDAAQLYQALAAGEQLTGWAAIGIGCGLGAASTAAARGIEAATRVLCEGGGVSTLCPPGHEPVRESHPVLFWLSTVYFLGIFSVFHCALAFALKLYTDHTTLLRNATRLCCGVGAAYCTGAYLDDDTDEGRDTTIACDHVLHGDNAAAAFEQQRVREQGAHAAGGYGAVGSTEEGEDRLGPYNVSHLRAWEAVRGVLADQLTSSRSLLHAYFTPTASISGIGLLASYLYLVDSFLIRRSSVGPAVVTAAVLLTVFAIYIVLVLRQARRSQAQFALHGAVIARVSLDVTLEQSLRLERRLTARQQRSGPLHDAGDADLAALNSTVRSMQCFIDSAVPRPLILGFQHRYMRYAVAYVLLLSAGALLYAFATQMEKCAATYDNTTSTP